MKRQVEQYDYDSEVITSILGCSLRDWDYEKELTEDQARQIYLNYFEKNVEVERKKVLANQEGKWYLFGLNELNEESRKNIPTIAVKWSLRFYENRRIRHTIFKWHKNDPEKKCVLDWEIIFSFLHHYGFYLFFVPLNTTAPNDGLWPPPTGEWNTTNCKRYPDCVSDMDRYAKRFYSFWLKCLVNYSKILL